MDSHLTRPEGLRERKRRKTRQRIIEAGLRLFMANGYEATTLDAIADAADISRRTYFSYFGSKEDLLLAWQDDAEAELRAGLIEEAPHRAPLDAVHRAQSKVIARYETGDFVSIDRVMRSTEALRARKQGNYERQERALFAALCEIWPEPERRSGLRMVAMVAIGAWRLALEEWIDDGQARPIAEYLDEAFAQVTAQFSRARQAAMSPTRLGGGSE